MQAGSRPAASRAESRPERTAWAAGVGRRGKSPTRPISRTPPAQGARAPASRASGAAERPEVPRRRCGPAEWKRSKTGTKTAAAAPPQRASPSRRARAQAAARGKRQRGRQQRKQDENTAAIHKQPPCFHIYGQKRRTMPAAAQARRPPTGGEKVSKQRKGRLTPRGWLRLLFGQPPAGMYRRPAVYMTAPRWRSSTSKPSAPTTRTSSAWSCTAAFSPCTGTGCRSSP